MKKNIPLALHKAIEPFLAAIRQTDFTIDRKHPIFKVLDSDPKSDFFFMVIKHEIRDNKNVLSINQKPTSDSVIGAIGYDIWLDEFNQRFSKWISLIKEYQNIDTVFDDPIIDRYEKEFIADFEILDDDADKVSFDFQKQLKIDAALSNVIALLESKREEFDKDKIDELIEEAKQIQEVITESTKAEIVAKVSRLFAKIRKVGMKLIKDAYPILQKEIISNAVKGAISMASDPQLHQTVSDLLQ